MHISILRAGVALVLGCGASVTVQASAPATRPTFGTIVFDRLQVNPDTTINRSGLSLTTPDTGTVKTLAPMIDGVIDDAATWSARGTRIAFEHGSATSNPADRFDIFVIDTRTQQLRQLTSGVGNFVTPAWGPGNRIAFVSRYRHGNCLSISRTNGQHRDLFCAPAPVELMRPMWSKDGGSLYIQAGYYTGSLEPLWRSLAYLVNARTGTALVLHDQVLQESMHMEFAPDGSRGILSNTYPYASEMSMVNFATGVTIPLPSGYAPRWSKDGRRIAFTGEIYEANPPSVVYYEPLFVMRADGSHVRRVTSSRVDNHAYTAADWSRDGVHLLINRRIYLDPSLTVPCFAMRIVNVDTGALKYLPQGYAEAGAWFER